MKVGALFTDYDGTIAPVDAEREDSQVPQEIRRQLEAISRRIPVAVITSKDYRFVQPRTEFASAWATAAGLETVLSDGRVMTLAAKRDISAVLKALVEVLPAGGHLVEEKRSFDGTMIGFCIEWSHEGTPEWMHAALRLLKEEGIHPVRSAGSKYLDVYAAEPDKGRALLELKKVLGVRGGVLYMGDSPLDNPAFEKSDVAIGVDHGQPLAPLRCDWRVRFDSVGAFLESLLKNGLDWDEKAALALGGTRA